MSCSNIFYFRALDVITNSPEGLKMFIFDYNENSKSGYETLLEMFSKKLPSRLKVSVITHKAAFVY